MLNRIFLSPPHLGTEEINFVKQAFDSNYIAPLGPQVEAFEKEFSKYTGIKHCLALSSGTAAMHLVMRDLGIGADDEVLASTLTFIGSVSPIVFEGAVPVFIDCDETSWNMDPVLLEEELKRCSKKGKLPKAVVPTDLYGQCCYYNRIYALCEEYGVPVVMDSAEAMGARYYAESIRGGDQSLNNKGEKTAKDTIGIHAGVGAKAAVYSFNGNKIMTTSGGGILASEDEEMIAHARKLSQQAREPFPHYEHEEIGYNYRMSNVLAGIGRGQLQVLDERVRRKREIFDYYREAMKDLPGISFMPEPEWSRSNRWLSVVVIEPGAFGADRETVRQALEMENIESRPVWKPMHLQPVFQNKRWKPEGGSLKAPVECDHYKGRAAPLANSEKKSYPCRVVGGKVSEGLFDKGLCLPSGTVMENSDLDRIIDIIRGCCRGL